MRWKDSRQSGNVEDRRGSSGGFSKGGFPFGLGGGSGGGRGGFKLSLPLIILFGVLYFVFGVNPLSLLGGGSSGISVPQTQTQASSGQGFNDESKAFVASVLGSTEDIWAQIFPAEFGKNYQPTTLVMFSGVSRSACGMAQSATGPFYCPGDRKVYLDTSFFDELSRRFGAPGDFAQAYVIAHEVAHHIQTVLGISDQVHQAKRKNPSMKNELSVRQELQADCLAGVWAYYADKKYGLLEQGDLQEAMVAAQAIGDDRLQKQAQGFAVPDSFTHGTSEQRQRWLMRGVQTGDVNNCDTFSTNSL